MVRSGRFRASSAGSKDLKATGKWGPRYVTWVKLTEPGLPGDAASMGAHHGGGFTKGSDFRTLRADPFRLNDESTGKFFWHFNTHWCVHSEGNRVCNEGVRYRGARSGAVRGWNMVKAIQDVAGNAPVVVTGDFNARM
eukprot:Skav202822  [mRNA]  locus=scaffold3852:113832:115656:- [translate_table: standard]